MDAWIVYEGVRIEWKTKHLRKSIRRKGLQTFARRRIGCARHHGLQDFRGVGCEGIKLEDLNPQLATLIKLNREGLIECYVLLGHPTWALLRTTTPTARITATN